VSGDIPDWLVARTSGALDGAGLGTRKIYLGKIFPLSRVGARHPSSVHNEKRAAALPL